MTMGDRFGDAMQAFATGEIVDGKYRIEGFLGAGAMAAVFRATDIMLERPVAMKVLCEGDPASLKAKARTMARIRHDNVVQVHAFGEHHEMAFVVMELVEGTNLEQTIVRQ